MPWVLSFIEDLRMGAKVMRRRRYLDGPLATSDPAEAYVYDSREVAAAYLAEVRASDHPWSKTAEMIEIPEHVAAAPGWTWRLVDEHLLVTDPSGVTYRLVAGPDGKPTRLPWPIVL